MDMYHNYFRGGLFGARNLSPLKVYLFIPLDDVGVTILSSWSLPSPSYLVDWLLWWPISSKWNLAHQPCPGVINDGSIKWV